MIEWTSTKDEKPKGFTPLLLVVTYPQERFFRQGYYADEADLWYTTSGTASFAIRHPDAVVTHWSYVNMPDDTCKCAVPGFDVANPNFCPTCKKPHREA